jgi:hypothetical protein
MPTIGHALTMCIVYIYLDGEASIVLRMGQHEACAFCICSHMLVRYGFPFKKVRSLPCCASMGARGVPLVLRKSRLLSRDVCPGKGSLQ